MGDMAQVFNDLRAHNKERKEARVAVNVEKLNAAGIPMREQSKNVFRLDTEWGAVMYYPGSSMWQHRGKTCRGSVSELKAWLTKQGFIS